MQMTSRFCPFLLLFALEEKRPVWPVIVVPVVVSEPSLLSSLSLSMTKRMFNLSPSLLLILLLAAVICLAVLPQMTMADNNNQKKSKRFQANPTTTAAAAAAAAVSRPLDRKIQVLNEAHSKIELNWINPDTKQRVLMSTPNIMPGADFSLNSFVNHAFEVREVPSEKSGKCGGVEEFECRTDNFTVSAHDDQVIRVTPDVKVVIVDNVVKAQMEASDLVRDCQRQAKAKIAAAASMATTTAEKNSEADAVLEAMEELVLCVEGGVARRLESVHEEIAFQASVRKGIAEKLENYTCLDETTNTSKSIHDEPMRWYSQADGVTRTVHVKHERPASRIHVIENFISPEECRAMEEEALKKLHRATVADGKGGSRLSEARKAMQAGIKVNWDLENASPEVGGGGHYIAKLSRRVYDYTNHVLGLNIKEFGQEDLMSIQYFGRGFNDTEPDRYMPHCDGDCTGLPHKNGTRMATMVMYCDVPARGGHTNFRNSGVHVKPEPGNAIFFSYIDPITLTMDTGFTEHSGCPVFEGHKKIVTQWIRLGVDSENPWDSFNTLGIKIKDVEMQEIEAHAEMLFGEDGEDEDDNEEYDIADDDEEEDGDNEEDDIGDDDEEEDDGEMDGGDEL